MSGLTRGYARLARQARGRTNAPRSNDPPGRTWRLVLFFAHRLLQLRRHLGLVSLLRHCDRSMLIDCPVSPRCSDISVESRRYAVPIAGVGFIIPLAEPDMQVSLHPALHAQRKRHNWSAHVEVGEDFRLIRDAPPRQPPGYDARHCPGFVGQRRLSTHQPTDLPNPSPTRLSKSMPPISNFRALLFQFP